VVDWKALLKRVYSSSSEPISKLPYMGSHSVICRSTQVNVPCLNPSQAGRNSIYLPRRDGRL